MIAVSTLCAKNCCSGFLEGGQGQFFYSNTVSQSKLLRAKTFARDSIRDSHLSWLRKTCIRLQRTQNDFLDTPLSSAKQVLVGSFTAAKPQPHWKCHRCFAHSSLLTNFKTSLRDNIWSRIRGSVRNMRFRQLRIVVLLLGILVIFGRMSASVSLCMGVGSSS